MDEPKTRYALSGDAWIAYQTVGEGVFDLLVVSGVGHHLELGWEDPHRREWNRTLASFCRLILFDKRGTGMSDPLTGHETLESRMEDIRAVLDDAGSERTLLFAVGDGGPLAILFAATYPERTLGLVLWHSQPRLSRAPDLPWLEPRGDLERRRVEMTARVRDADAMAESVATQNPSLETAQARRAFARPIRLSLSPGALATYFRATLDVDVRDILAVVRVPTLVLSRKNVAVYDIRSSHYLAERIPGARLVELGGRDFAPLIGDTESVRREVKAFAEECLAAESTSLREPERVLATVLFTDIVGSTSKALELGDARWTELLAEHHTIVRAQLSRFRGWEVDTAGDGFLATFDGPARAIRCAVEIREAVRGLGVELRAGVHSGECEVVDGKVGGIAVHIGARVASGAEAGEILVSSTVRDLVAGSGIVFEERGERELKDLPGKWRLYAVASVGA